jgi:hypothetical protein
MGGTTAGPGGGTREHAAQQRDAGQGLQEHSTTHKMQRLLIVSDTQLLSDYKFSSK